MERLFGGTFPPDYKSRKGILLLRGIALWDVIRSCDIKGSSDQSIRNVVPMDLNRILKTASIRPNHHQWRTAHGLYMKYCREQTGRDAVDALPPARPMRHSHWTAWLKHGHRPFTVPAKG